MTAPAQLLPSVALPALGLALVAVGVRRALAARSAGRLRRRLAHHPRAVARRSAAGPPGEPGRTRRAAPPAPRRAPPWVERRVRSAALAGDPVGWWHGWLAGLAASLLTGAILAGPGAAVVLGAAWVGVPPVLLHLRRGRADRELELQLPALLEATARGVRAGAGLGDALVAARREVATSALVDDVAAIGRAIERGSPLRDAVDAWALRRPLPGVQLAAAALGLAADQGGAQARAVDGVAATLRERHAVAEEVHAAAAQVRASVAIMGLAPLGFAAVSVLLDPQTARAAVSSVPGIVSVVAGLALDLVAIVWMQRLTAATG